MTTRLRECTSSVIEEDLGNTKSKAVSKSIYSAIKFGGKEGEESNEYFTKCIVPSLQLVNNLGNEIESSSIQEAELEISSDIYQNNKIPLYNGQIKQIKFVGNIWKESVKSSKISNFEVQYSD